MSPLSGTDGVRPVMRLLLDAVLRNHFMAGRVYRTDPAAFTGLTSESILAAIAAHILSVFHDRDPAAADALAADVAGWAQDGEPLYEWAVRVAAAWGVDVEAIAREIDHLPSELIMPVELRAKKVTICGSTQFRPEITEANRMLTLAGFMVYAPGVFGHDGDAMTDKQKAGLDLLHRQKIQDSDEVYVVNSGGYIGDSTQAEIEYAESLRKPISYLVEPAGVAGTLACMSAQEWNDAYPPGTAVRYWTLDPGRGQGVLSKTRSEAWTLGHGMPVVSVEGRSGGLALTHVVPVAAAPVLPA